MTSGHCLCGEVELTLTEPKKHVHACHCSTCRTWGGGPLYSIEAGSAVTFKGEDAITRFASSAWAERGFCHRCGTHLFYLLKEVNAYYLPAGLFKDATFELDTEIFVDEKVDYCPMSANSRKITGAEVMAAFTKE